MNGHGGDDGMEPTTDAVEAVQPDQDALLIAELKQALRALHEWALMIVPYSYQEGTAGKRIYNTVQELLLEQED